MPCFGLTYHRLIEANNLPIYRLFDIVPGLKNLDLATSLHGQSKGMAFATYMSVSSASYARNKLNNIEYPPGFRLGVSYKQEPRMQPAFHQPVAQPVVSFSVCFVLISEVVLRSLANMLGILRQILVKDIIALLLE